MSLYDRVRAEAGRIAAEAAVRFDSLRIFGESTLDAGYALARSLRSPAPQSADPWSQMTWFHPESFRQLREPEIVPEWGWTLDRLQAAIQGQSLGDIMSGQRLMMAMMRDPVICHGVETRAETLTQIPFRWERPEGCPQWLFDIWVANWHESLLPSDHQQLGEYRVVLGVAPVNVTWAPDPSGLAWMPRQHLREPCNLLWRSDPDDRRYYFNGLDKQHAVTNDGERFLLYKRSGRRPHLSGAMLPLAVSWFTKQEAFRGWPSHNRSHVKPQRWLKVPINQRESDDVKRLVAQAQQLLSGGVMVLPADEKDRPSFDFGLTEAKSMAYVTFKDLIQLCDNYSTLVLMGATENTQGGSASNAKAVTHDKVTLRKVKADAKSSAEAQTTLARTMMRMNRLPPQYAPVPIYDADPPEDQNELAKRQQLRGLAGMQLGSMITQLDAHNAAQGAKAIEYEANYLAEQVGLQLTRGQDGYQTRPM